MSSQMQEAQPLPTMASTKLAKRERRKNNEDGKYYCTHVGALTHSAQTRSLTHATQVLTQAIRSHNTTNGSQTGDASMVANVYYLDPCLFWVRLWQLFVSPSCLLMSCCSNVFHSMILFFVRLRWCNSGLHSSDTLHKIGPLQCFSVSNPCKHNSNNYTVIGSSRTLVNLVGHTNAEGTNIYVDSKSLASIHSIAVCCCFPLFLYIGLYLSHTPH